MRPKHSKQKNLRAIAIAGTVLVGSMSGIAAIAATSNSANAAGSACTTTVVTAHINSDGTGSGMIDDFGYRVGQANAPAGKIGSVALGPKTLNDGTTTTITSYDIETNDPSSPSHTGSGSASYTVPTRGKYITGVDLVGCNSKPAAPPTSTPPTTTPPTTLPPTTVAPTTTPPTTVAPTTPITPPTTPTVVPTTPTVIPTTSTSSATHTKSSPPTTNPTHTKSSSSGTITTTSSSGGGSNGGGSGSGNGGSGNGVPNGHVDAGQHAVKSITLDVLVLIAGLSIVALGIMLGLFDGLVTIRRRAQH